MEWNQFTKRLFLKAIIIQTGSPPILARRKWTYCASIKARRRNIQHFIYSFQFGNNLRSSGLGTGPCRDEILGLNSEGPHWFTFFISLFLLFLLNLFFFGWICVGERGWTPESVFTELAPLPISMPCGSGLLFIRECARYRRRWLGMLLFFLPSPLPSSLEPPTQSMNWFQRLWLSLWMSWKPSWTPDCRSPKKSPTSFSPSSVGRKVSPIEGVE